MDSCIEGSQRGILVGVGHERIPDNLVVIVFFYLGGLACGDTEGAHGEYVKASINKCHSVNRLTGPDQETKSDCQ